MSKLKKPVISSRKFNKNRRRMKLAFILFLLFLGTNYCECKGKYYIKPRTFDLSNSYTEYLNEYENYKKYEPEYEKIYKNETLLKARLDEFHRIKRSIQEHNENYKLGLVQFSRKLMPYSDWGAELKYKRLCGARLAPKPRTMSNGALLKAMKAWPKLPPGTEVNNCQFPNPVRDQQTCGCCWAFASISVLESILFTKKGIRTDLSVQQLVDCDNSNEACDGGWPTAAFQYMRLNGVTSSSLYPYKDDKQSACKKAGLRDMLPKQFIVKVIEIEFKGDEEALRKLLYRIKSPVVVAGHANEALMSTHLGRYSNDTCPKDDPNHAMVICGFGNEKGFDYWLVRNSWSPSWGENGYIKMAANNTCGISSFAMFPVIVGVRELDPFLGEAFEQQRPKPDRRRRD